MSDGVYVEQAAVWSRALIRWKARGPGDLDNAMRSISREYKIEYALLWKLRYRKPKDIMTSWYFKLKTAYEAERQRQMRKLQHEIEITKAIAGDADDYLASAEAFVRENEAMEK